MPKKWYIVERRNPQLGTYYYSIGQRTKKDAMKYENAIYGRNAVLSYETQEQHDKALAELCRW